MTVDKLKMHSPDLTLHNIEKIAELFPTVVTETFDPDGDVVRAIDFDALRQELADHIVEGPQERYQLDWPGKRAAAFAANAPIAKTLRPARSDSVDFDTTKNLFVEGDNLDALKLLQESYLGKVKLIYIDPPYNTGSDFIYDDDFAESSADYLARSGQKSESGERLVANTEANGRFHSDWLSMMYPRLKLARNLLSPEGIIFVSVDDHEASNLRRLMDEVFGSNNFFAEFAVVRAEGGGLAKRVVKGHDYLIGYTRDAERFPGMFREKDVRGKVVSVKDQDYWIETDWLRAEFGKYGTLQYEDIEAVKGVAKKQEIDAGIRAGIYRLIPRGDGHIVGRLRPLDKDGSKFYSVIKHLNKDAKEALIPLGLDGMFSNPKPLSLIYELVMGATRFSRSAEHIVLDFFAGSGTTAHAVLKANADDGGNRRYVLVQWSEAIDKESPAGQAGYATIPELTRERLRRTGAASKVVDRGFRALRVDTTNMADTSAAAEALAQEELAGMIDSVKSDRSDEDLLFQVLLDWGLDLSVSIVREASRGSEGRRPPATYFRVADDALIACFIDEVTADMVTEIANLQPLRAVFRDSAFNSDADRINAEQIFRELSPATDVKTV